MLKLTLSLPILLIIPAGLITEEQKGQYESVAIERLEELNANKGLWEYYEEHHNGVHVELTSNQVKNLVLFYYLEEIEFERSNPIPADSKLYLLNYSLAVNLYRWQKIKRVDAYFSDYLESTDICTTPSNEELGTVIIALCS